MNKIRKVGRPGLEITPELLDKVEGLAAQGLTQEQIALSTGMCLATLHNKKNENIDFLEAIKRGQAKGVATVANALFQSATTGRNTVAQIFYLKNRASQEWKDRTEHAGTLEFTNKTIMKMSQNEIVETICQDEQSRKLIIDELKTQGWI